MAVLTAFAGAWKHKPLSQPGATTMDAAGVDVGLFVYGANWCHAVLLVQGMYDKIDQLQPIVEEERKAFRMAV